MLKNYVVYNNFPGTCRDFLSHVNSTHNPKGFMKIAMREPLFVEFADACLKVVHPGETLYAFSKYALVVIHNKENFIF